MAEITFNRIRTIGLDVFGDVPTTSEDIINYGTSAAFGINGLGPDATLLIRWTVLITTPPKEDGSFDRMFGGIVTESSFIVPELDSYRGVDGYRIPKALVIPLVEAACSTTRGVLLARAAGTLLEKMPLPLVDGSKMLASVDTVDIPIPKEILKQIEEKHLAMA